MPTLAGPATSLTGPTDMPEDPKVRGHVERREPRCPTRVNMRLISHAAGAPTGVAIVADSADSCRAGQNGDLIVAPAQAGRPGLQPNPSDAVQTLWTIKQHAGATSNAIATLSRGSAGNHAIDVSRHAASAACDVGRRVVADCCAVAT